jgi:hypothetical protein
MFLLVFAEFDISICQMCLIKRVFLFLSTYTRPHSGIDDGWLTRQPEAPPSVPLLPPPTIKRQYSADQQLPFPPSTILSCLRILQILTFLVAVGAILYSSVLKEGVSSVRTVSGMTVTNSLDPSSWRQQLDALPAGGRIPAFYFAHGCIFTALRDRADGSAVVDLAGKITLEITT